MIQKVEMSEANISDNARRWLKAISFAEGTWANNKPKYDIMFGGGTFDDLSRHPDRVIQTPRYSSAAAGAYQFMPSTWESVQSKLNLPDFSPLSQDLGAIELIRRRGVNPDTDPINRETLSKLAPEWASFPTLEGVSYYGQPNKAAESIIAFAYGGELPPQNTYAAAEPGGETQVGQPGSDGKPSSLEGILKLLRDKLDKQPDSTPSSVTYQSPSLESTAEGLLKREQSLLGQMFEQSRAEEQAQKDLAKERELINQERGREVNRSKEAAAALALQALSAFNKTPQSLI
jgi:muramidase (phage lysozyme)